MPIRPRLGGEREGVFSLALFFFLLSSSLVIDGEEGGGYGWGLWLPFLLISVYFQLETQRGRRGKGRSKGNCLGLFLFSPESISRDEERGYSSSPWAIPSGIRPAGFSMRRDRGGNSVMMDGSFFSLPFAMTRAAALAYSRGRRRRFSSFFAPLLLSI